MKTAELAVHYVAHMGTDLTPVNAARISFGGESQAVTEKDTKLIHYLADHEHLSPFEHQTLTVLIECPLFIRSQIHRHRTFAYNEVSRRYTADDLEFYLPGEPDIRKQSKSNKQGSDGSIDEDAARVAYDWMHDLTENCERIFGNLLDLGVAREQARMVLPQNLMTKFYMTGNLRNWAHFLKLRLDVHAQKEVQDIAGGIALVVKKYWPVSFEALMK